MKIAGKIDDSDIKSDIKPSLLEGIQELNIDNLLNSDIIKKIFYKTYGRYSKVFDSFQDAKQEAFICLMKCVKTFKIDKKCSFNTYYTNRLQYKCWDLYNKKKKEWENVVQEKEEINQIVELIPKIYNDYSYNFLNSFFYLTEKEKGLLFRYYYEDKTYREIGIEFGVSKQRIEQLVKKTIAKIKLRSRKDFEYGTAAN